MNSWPFRITGKSLVDIPYKRSAYANPADGRFYVELGRDACLEILSAQGVVVRPAMELDAGCHEVDMSGQAAGLYFLRLTASQESRVFKLLLR